MLTVDDILKRERFSREKWEQASDMEKVLVVMYCMNNDPVVPEELAKVLGWDVKRVRRALDASVDLGLVWKK